MKILILSSMHKSAVAAVRALARAGHRVDLGISVKAGRSAAALRFSSRYAEKSLRMPHPLHDAAHYLECLLDVLAKQTYDAVLPFSDQEAVVVARSRAAIMDRTGVALPDFKTFCGVHDKALLHQRLTKAGFDVPEFYVPDRYSELVSLPIRFPVVVKARRNAGVRSGLRYVSNADELGGAYQDVTAQSSPDTDTRDYARPLIQEFIPGTIHDGLFLCNRGRVVAGMTSRRDETFPLRGGVGVTCTTTYEPDLLEYGRRILKELNWHGPCEVECKKDSRDGSLKLLEINPRFWGQLDLAIRAGINFPEKTAELAAKANTSDAFEYRIGLRYKFLFPLEFYCIYLDRGNRWKRLLRLRHLLRPDTVCEVDLRDPLPNLLDLMDTAYTLLLKREELRRLDEIDRRCPV